MEVLYYNSLNELRSLFVRFSGATPIPNVFSKVSMRDSNFEYSSVRHYLILKIFNYFLTVILTLQEDPLYLFHREEL